jgi:hypothetical protein
MDDGQSVFTALGKAENRCPHCDVDLERRPSRKTKCPNCGNFMYVRTRPYDMMQVLVTYEEAELIDRQRSVTSGIHDGFIYEAESLDAMRKELTKRLQRPPTDFEVKSEICLQQQSGHAKEWNWGLYRNNRFQIAEFQRAAGRLPKALAIYYEVCYIDLNGPNNSGALREWPDLLKEHPPFRPDREGLAPAIIELLSATAGFLNLNADQIKIGFLEVAERVRQEIGTPLSAAEAWTQLEPKLSISAAPE